MRKIVGLASMLLLTAIVSWAQTKISGTVRDQNGDPDGRISDIPLYTVPIGRHNSQ